MTATLAVVPEKISLAKLRAVPKHHFVGFVPGSTMCMHSPDVVAITNEAIITNSLNHMHIGRQPLIMMCVDQYLFQDAT